MKSSLRIIVLILAFCVFAVSANEDKALYHEAYQKLHDRGQFNGAVLIAKNNQIVVDEYFGSADKLENRVLTAESLYRLASVSKTMTSTALLTLVDAGRLSLDDHVQAIIPRFPYADITVRQILQHSSGLPEYIFGVGDYWSAAKGPMTNADVLNWLIATKPDLAFVSGQGWEYCNTGYALIPLMIESITKTPYPLFLRTAVFDKAGMKSSYHISEVGPAQLPRVAAGHGFDYAAGADVRADKHSMLANEFKAERIFGAGDVFSTARDLLQFDQALNENRLISAELQAEAYTSMKLPEGFPAGYGLGWQVADSEFTGRIIHHHGLGDGYRTRFYRFIDKGITIVTLQNARELYADDAVRVAQQLAFKGTYTLPPLSLAEAVSVVMHEKGVKAALGLVKKAADETQRWSVNQRDLNNLAFTYWYKGDRKSSIKLLTGYIALMPTDPNSYVTLAEALEEGGRHKRALAYYKKALEVAKADPGKYAREIEKIGKVLDEDV